MTAHHGLGGAVENVPRCPVCSAMPTGRAVHRTRDRTRREPRRFLLLRCSRCGLVWLADRLPKENAHEAYPDDYYSFVDGSKRERGIRRHAQRARLCLLQHRYNGRNDYLLGGLGRMLPAYPHTSRPGIVLDVGCGAGSRLLRLKCASWTGVGVEPDAHGAARAYAAGLHVCRGHAERLPLAAATFDCVLMSHAIEHAYDPRSALREAIRVLKPDGHVVITTPNTSSLACVVFGRHWVNWDSPRHTVVFDRRSLTRLFDSEGLEVVSLRGSATGWSWIESMAAMARARTRQRFTRVPLLARALAFLLAMGLNRTPWADEIEIVGRIRTDRTPPYSENRANQRPVGPTTS
jgi:SAM-dependent methyltransferase